MDPNQQTVIQAILRERIELLAYINSFLTDAHLAEDCFQEVFAAAVDRSETFEDQSHIIRWTMAAARNKAIDLARKRSRQPALLDGDILELLEKQWTDNLHAHPSDANIQSTALRKCLEKLTDNNRRLIELRYFDGLNSGRIAELLGRNVESVYKAITRIHVTLRTCLEQNVDANHREAKP